MAAVLVALAAGCLWLSWGPLRNLFADYQDSPVWVYLGYGGFWLALAAALLWQAWRGLR